MTKIKIIGGRYGHISPSGVYSVKTVDDPPFEVEDSEAERLYKRGIATIIRESNVPLHDMRGPDWETNTGELSDDETDSVGFPYYNKDSTNAELQAIAKEYGVELPPRANKAQILEALDDFFGGTPIISAKEPE